MLCIREPCLSKGHTRAISKNEITVVGTHRAHTAIDLKTFIREPGDPLFIYLVSKYITQGKEISPKNIAIGLAKNMSGWI
jgi:hypothetical protein